MEELKNNKIYKSMILLFVFVSIIHLFYVITTNRGLYMDGSFYCLQLLDNISNEKLSFVFDFAHPRYMLSILMQIPMYIAGLFLNIDNKFALMSIYSCSQFLLPLLAFLWNFNLTKRTGKIDILFWNIFAYGILLLPFSIFSVVESLIGASFHFVLWNYLVSDIDYKKRDIIAILFLLVIMYATYEYVAVLGVVFFLAHFQYLMEPKISLKSQTVKAIIGLGSLGASIYNIVFMFKTPGEGGEILRFMKEAHDFLPYVFDLNSLFSLAAFVFLLVFAFSRKKISLWSVLFVFFVFISLLIKMLLNQQLSVHPMWEGHFRTLPCWALPLIFSGMAIKDVFSKKINYVKYSNLIVIVLIACIFQTIWQCVHTYYWDKNIQYMKNELLKEPSPLYIPTEHEELSGFHNEHLRRYIWHGSYTATSVLFSDTYEQKTLLMLYDKQIDEGNVIDRKALFVDEKAGKISIPFGAYVDIKNKFWDLTNVAKALDDYNNENNIETYK